MKKLLINSAVLLNATPKVTCQREVSLSVVRRGHLQSTVHHLQSAVGHLQGTLVSHHKSVMLKTLKELKLVISI